MPKFPWPQVASLGFPKTPLPSKFRAPKGRVLAETPNLLSEMLSGSLCSAP